MQTPVMSMPYNLGTYENGENTKYSIDVAFRDLDSDYRVNGFTIIWFNQEILLSKWYGKF